MRLNFSDFHKVSSKIASFQIGSAPQFHRFSPIFVETCQFSNKEYASISQIFVENCSFSKKEFRRKLSNVKGGVRGAGSTRNPQKRMVGPKEDKHANELFKMRKKKRRPSRRSRGPLQSAAPATHRSWLSKEAVWRQAQNWPACGGNRKLDGQPENHQNNRYGARLRS